MSALALSLSLAPSSSTCVYSIPLLSVLLFLDGRVESSYFTTPSPEMRLGDVCVCVHTPAHISRVRIQLARAYSSRLFLFGPYSRSDLRPSRRGRTRRFRCATDDHAKGLATRRLRCKSRPSSRCALPWLHLSCTHLTSTVQHHPTPPIDVHKPEPPIFGHSCCLYTRPPMCCAGEPE